MCLLPARSSLTFRQLYNVDSIWNEYVTWWEHTVKCTVQISTHNTPHSSKVSLVKWLSVHLWTKWLWVQVQLQSLKFTQFSVLFNDPWGNQKIIRVIITALITQKLPKLKKKIMNLLSRLLSSLFYLMTFDSIKKQLALLLTP